MSHRDIDPVGDPTDQLLHLDRPLRVAGTVGDQQQSGGRVGEGRRSHEGHRARAYGRLPPAAPRRDHAEQISEDGECAAPVDGLPVVGGGVATPEACFQVYDRSGTEVEATAATTGTDTMTVVANFANGELDEALGASVDDGAVTETSGTENAANQVDELPLAGQLIAAGSTVGPDVVTATVVTTGDQGTDTVVEDTFDEDVVTADATRFFVYDSSGAPAPAAAAVVDADDHNVVQVTFADNESTIADAVTATVNDLAAVDEDGDSNPEGSAGSLR